MNIFQRSLTGLRRIARIAREDYEKNVQLLLSKGWTVLQCPSCDNAFYVKDVAPPRQEWRCPCGVPNMQVRKR